MIRRRLAALCFMSLGVVLASQASARDEKCIAAMHERVQVCTNECVDKARAAVDPSVKDLIIGRACAKNCLKIEMFHGQACA